MARRRLTPTAALLEDVAADVAADVPRAEHRLPPIARVAAEAAGAAAVNEMAETLRRARDEGRMVVELPTAAIAPDHLLRDRMPAEDAEAVALRASLRLHGQRTPIEVTPLAGAGALPYGLISGWRRLEALKALFAETGDPRFATVLALVRQPATAADAYVAMVEENEIRASLSQYERARVAARATERGVFPSEKAALLALFATASRPKRSRIRAFLEIYHALDGALRFPAHLPERLGLQLVETLRAGGGPAVAAALAAGDARTPAAELAILARAVRMPRPVRPVRAAPAAPVVASVVAPVVEILPGIVLEQRLRGDTLTLRLKGEGVTAAFAAAVQAALGRLA